MLLHMSAEAHVDIRGQLSGAGSLHTVWDPEI